MRTEPGLLQKLELDRRRSRANHTDFPGRSIREIEHALPHKWPTVGDGHDDGTTIAEIGHPQAGSERQSAMGCGQLIHIEPSATGREATMMWLPIPGGHTLEGMGGLFAAPEQAETEQSGENRDAKRTVTPGPVKVIAQACEVLYH
jgi:hypothetical protein